METKSKNEINLKKQISCSVEEAVSRLTEALKTQGFGVLTRIDFHSKMKEKLGKELPPVVILGACNPELAWEAYGMDTDVTSLIPCNAVIREVASGRVSIELAKPSEMMKALGNLTLVQLSCEADDRLKKVLEQLSS